MLHYRIHHTWPQANILNIIYIYIYIYIHWGRRVIGIFGSLIWSKTLMELKFNPCGEFRWNSEGPISQIHSLHLHIDVPGIFSGLLRSVQLLKRESGVRKAAGSYCTYPSLVELQPGFLSLRRNTCLWLEMGLGFWVYSKRPALGQYCGDDDIQSVAHSLILSPAATAYMIIYNINVSNIMDDITLTIRNKA